MNKKVLLFAPQGAWTMHHQLDAVLGAALQMRGADVAVVGCDGVFTNCQAAGKPPQAAACRGCAQTGRGLFAALQVPVIQLSEVLSREDLQHCRQWVDAVEGADCCEATFDHHPLGRWVYAGVCQYLLSGCPDTGRELVVRTYRDFLYNGALVLRAAERLLTTWRPDHVICYSGISAFYRVFAEVARHRGIPVLAHERGMIDDSFLFCINGNEWQPSGRPEAWQPWRDQPLSLAECNELAEYLSQREQGRNINRPAYYTLGGAQGDVRNRLAIPAGAKLVAIFPNSDWELGMSRVDVPRSFASSAEAIRTIVRTSRLHDHYFAIRLHPNMIGPSHTDTNFLEQMLALGRELPPNFRLVMPKERLTSYELVWQADAAFTFGSTIGPEAWLRGTGTVTNVDKIYSMIDMGIAKCPQLEDFDAAVRAAVERTTAFGLADLQKAYRGFHFICFKLSFRFTSFGIKDLYHADIRIGSREDLLPGRDPALDRVCGYLLEGTGLYPVPQSGDPTRRQDDERGFLEKQLAAIRDKRRQVRRTDRPAALAGVTVVRVRRDGRSAPADTVLAASLKRGRHPNTHVAEAAVARDGDTATLVAELSGALAGGADPYVVIGTDAMHLDESFLIAGVAQLEEDQNRDGAALLGGVWICDQPGRITGELFTERSGMCNWSELVGICPWLQKDPVAVLGLFLWRRQALLDLLAGCDAGQPPEVTARCIFETMVDPASPGRVVQSLVPAVAMYPPADPEALTLDALVALRQENAAQALSIFGQARGLGHREPRMEAGQARALVALGKPWQALAVVESCLARFPDDGQVRLLHDELRQRLADVPLRFEDVADAIDTVHSELSPGQDRYLFEKLRSLPDTALVLEIGAYHGRSTAALAFACTGSQRRVVSVDTFMGMTAGGTKIGNSFQDIWEANIDRLGLDGYVRAIAGLSHEVIGAWQNKPLFDFVFIDASHHYTDVLRDFRLVYPLVKDGGWIGFHDVEPAWPGPWRVWRQWAMAVLDEHQYVSSLACGRKVAGRGLPDLAAAAPFDYARQWADHLRAHLPELAGAMATTLSLEAGGLDPAELGRAEQVIAAMPDHPLVAGSLREMLKLEAGEDPYLNFWYALWLQGRGHGDEALSFFNKAAQAASPELKAAVNAHLGNRRTAVAATSLAAQPSAPVAQRPAGQANAPLCLFVTTYYPQFLDSLYQAQPQLGAMAYEDQLARLLAQCFGDSDFYSAGLRQAGWRAVDIICNCLPLQQAWARENGVQADPAGIWLEQIRRLRPQVVYLHDLRLATQPLLEQIRPHTELIAGQIACPLPAQADVTGLDMIFSSFPHFVERFRQMGITAHYQPLAFEPRVLDKIVATDRPHALTFVGGISPDHGQGTQLLESLAADLPLAVWGYGVEHLPATAAIRRHYRGQAWGLGMFQVLADSKITVNRHIDVARNNANNMRLFESTGCGALLITDYKDNLADLFEIGTEVVAYRSAEEAKALAAYYMAHPDQAAAIAAAGQRRTLRDHTYGARMRQTAQILARHLRYRREQERLGPVDRARVSTGYQTISADQVSPELVTAWQDAAIAPRQRALVQEELAAMYRGRPPVVYQVLAKALAPLVKAGTKLLEIGCASGYYYEILAYLLNPSFDYTGVDYAPALIDMARDYYPAAAFHVADGASLPFASESFEVVVSSCVLLHVANVAEHVAETARVARDHVVAHRTPVCRRRPTQYLKKAAYGIQTLELRFNEKELLDCFAANGLHLREAIEFAADNAGDCYEVTYIFAKTGTGRRPGPSPSLPAGPADERTAARSTPAVPAPAPRRLNLGCGHCFHPEWTNIDFTATGPGVIAHNLCRGIPFGDNHFDVVYHSNILEHFPKNAGADFMRECLRVLKPGGLLRVAVPDLEQIVRHYLRQLEGCLQGDARARQRYEWIVIELLDQMTRNQPGGEMLAYWRRWPMPVEDYVIERCGPEVGAMIRNLRARPAKAEPDLYLAAMRDGDEGARQALLNFYLSGEVHRWMYDRYSLAELMAEVGFTAIGPMSAERSAIPDFSRFGLDLMPDGGVRKPDSFFMEARKPDPARAPGAGAKGPAFGQGSDQDPGVAAPHRLPADAAPAPLTGATLIAQLTDLLASDRLDIDHPLFGQMVANPQNVGLSEEDLQAASADQRRELIVGEYLARISSWTGQMASRLLFKAQWGYRQPDWFDHRHHLLDPQAHFNDYWTASADNVVAVLPPGGSLLELCAGDGFYDYYFYRHRAGRILGVDVNPACHRQALRCHQAPNICYLLADVLRFEPEPQTFDVVSIRGAIEHFSEDDQQRIFQKALRALKPGGWFCGDTVAALEQGAKHLEAHETEWADETQMRRALQRVFAEVQTRSLMSRDRTTLLWRCRKAPS